MVASSLGSPSFLPSVLVSEACSGTRLVFGRRGRRTQGARYPHDVRSLGALIAAVAILTLAPSGAGAQSQAHTLTITTPAQFDFTLATVRFHGPTPGLRVSTVGPTGEAYIAAAATRTEPLKRVTAPPPLVAVPAMRTGYRSIFILVVNRQPRGATAREPPSVNVRIQTRAAEPAPKFSQHVDVLADGAPGQDCSALIYSPGLGHPYIYGDNLEPLAGGPAAPIAGTVGPGDAVNTVGLALAQTCGDQIDTTFERWVRQEPGPVHP
jgi:hypothetical protein